MMASLGHEVSFTYWSNNLASKKKNPIKLFWTNSTLQQTI